MSKRLKTASPVDRRIFLKRFAFGVAGVAGSVSSLGLLRKAAAAVIPLAPVEEGVVFGTAACNLQVSKDHDIAKSAYAAYPAHCLDEAGRIWATWSTERDEADSLHLRLFDPETEKWGETLDPTQGTPFSSWRSYQPQVAVCGGRLAVVWTATKDGQWNIVARTCDPEAGQWSAPRVLNGEKSTAYRPVLAEAGSNLIVAWEEKKSHGGHFAVQAQLLDKTGEPQLPAPATVGDSSLGDCCRASVAVHEASGNAAVVYDQYEGAGTSNIHMALLALSDLRTVTEQKVTAHPATDLAPDAAFSPNGDILWIGWHSNRRGEDEWDIPRWYRVIAYSIPRRQLNRPAWPPPMLKLDKRDTDQGFEFVRLVTAPDGSLVVTGRPSHRFCMQVYSGDKWSPLYRFPSEGWGGRGQHARGIFDAKGRFWVVRRDLGGNYLDCIEGLGTAEPGGQPKLTPVTLPVTVPALRNITPHFEFTAAGTGAPAPSPATAPQYNLYFGDLHGHTWMSDGMGEPEEIYRRARDIYHDDFCTVTDHDNFVDRKLLQAEYEEQKAIASHFNDPGKFVTFYAQEWTTPRTGRPKGFGHKNIYSLSADLPLYDHRNELYSETSQLFAELRKRGAIAIPHHIGWTGVDWENHDAEIQPLVEICSVHGAFEHMGNVPIVHRGGIPGNFVRDGLARGLRFGICGGSDQHGLIYQHGVCWKRECYRAGLTGILANELTREALFDAIRKRRTFGTSGIKLRPHFSVAGLTIGEEGKIEKPPAIEVDVLALSGLRWLTVVRNGEEIVQYGGEGTRSRFSFTDDRVPEKQTSYYYLKVEMRDGNMAWTSPIWVTPTA